MEYDLISIGSGSAGRRVAVALKRAGWNTAIIEKDVENHFGGTCICSGCIPTKALIEKVNHDKGILEAQEHKERIVERIRSGTLRHVEERSDIPVIRGEASFVDAHTLLVGDQQYSAKHVVIATGSTSIIPPIKGLDQVQYLTSYELLANETIPNHLLIIGGGRIGLELGQLYLKLGAKVTVFEGLDHLFANAEDHEMSDAIEEYLKEKGMEFFMGNFVSEVEQDENGQTTVRVPDDGEIVEVQGDMLLVSTGRQPNIAALNLENAGIKTDRGAIAVNEYFETSVPHIFAIGDVIGNPMFTNWASYQSGHLLKNLKVPRDEWEVFPDKVLPRIAFIDPEFASVGLTEEEARAMYGDEVVTYKFYNKWLGKSMIVDDWDGILKGIGRKGSNEILGAHLWGKRTGSLVQMIVLAMENNLGWNELADMVYGHPVLVEGIYSLSLNMKGLTSK